MINLNNIQWTSNNISHKNESFCSWLQKTSPVSQFLQGKLELPTRFKLISNNYLENQNVFCREAIIYNGDTPLIYAQTHFQQELVKEIPRLTQLGNSSLGFFLLEHGQFHKDRMDFGYLTQIKLLPAEIQDNPEIKKCNSLLCRRSILAIADYKADLIEVFLPGFEMMFTNKAPKF